MRLYSKSEARHIWKIRESGARSAAAAPGAPQEWEGWDDSAVAPEKLGGYLRDLRKLLDEYGYRTSFYGHFGHGCIHMRVTFDLESEGGIRRYGEFVERAADLVVSYGGSLSGEHGDGQSRGALLPKMYGPELVRAFAEFKAVWDPDNRMNPHKVVNAYLPTENLRLGADYKPMQPHTHFQFPDDGGSLAKASLRCVGLGECRQREAGSMCPTYLATLEEKHSTRGRAHMLFELLQGEVVRGRLAGRAREGIARPVPFLQGVQVGLPDQRGHRHVQGGISVALLRAQVAPAAGVRVRAGGPLGASWVRWRRRSRICCAMRRE